MSPESLKALLTRRPFLPFRLHVSDKATYAITRPELLVVGGAITFIGMVRDSQSVFFDEPVLVANRHITRAEPVMPEEVPT